MTKTLIAITVLLTLTANKCADKTGASTSAGLLDKKWVFQSINGQRLDLPDGTETPWLMLSGDQLQGFGGCNALMGGYTLSGDKLNFTSIASTKKYCEGIQPTENAVKELLGKVEGFKLGEGTVKLLGAGKELAELRGV